MKEGFESLGRVRLQGIALLAIAFAAGVAGGMALERVRVARAAPPPAPAFGRMHAGLPPGLERLDLTDEQRTKIQEIMRASRPRTDSILQQSLPLLAAIHDSVRAQIRAVLTPEQQKQFDEFAQGPFRMDRRRGFRGHGPPERPEDRGEPPPRPF